ncbi:MAG: hypothetical protein Kow0099_05140 [Candidatus Abyssubacteria bacterium]
MGRQYGGYASPAISRMEAWGANRLILSMALMPAMPLPITTCLKAMVFFRTITGQLRECYYYHPHAVLCQERSQSRRFDFGILS